MLQETSYSQQRTLLRCPKKFEYHYVRRIRPRQDELRFLVGGAVHRFLEVYYRELTDIDLSLHPDKSQLQVRAFERALEAFEHYTQTHFPTSDEAHEQANLAESMIRHYFSWAAEQDDFTVLGTEIPFEIHIGSTKFRGIFDGLVQVGEQLWVLEHKTVSQINTRHTLLDKQISVYVMAGRENGIPIEGVIYNTLRKAVPQKPKVLKSGKLSKSLNSNITYASYLEAIKELGQPIDAYADVLEELSQRSNTFFHREFVPRTQVSSEEAWRDIQKAEALKQALVGADIFPRNDTRDCVWDCPFYELCLAELEGNDITTLMSEKFYTDNIDKI